MQPLFLADDISFWDVIWFMVIIFFWTLVLWMFISIFADIFRRRDLSGWGKAGWVFLIFILPFIGVLIYMIVRPAGLPTDEPSRGYVGGSATEEIAKAQQLLQSGAITQAEFDQIKQRALA
jgi:hypothetical protein